MVKGLDKTKVKRKPWKTRAERDIKFSKDIKEAELEGGKTIGNNLSLFSFIIGIPLLIIGLYAITSMLFGFPINLATIILVFLVNVIGLLLIIGGYFIYRGN